MSHRSIAFVAAALAAALVGCGDGEREAAPQSRSDQIAFMTSRAGALRLGIFVMNPDGSEQRKLSDGADPAWSPDGRTIAYSRDGGIYTMDANGGNQRRRSSGQEAGEFIGVEESDPAWSPDGKTIAFASTRDTKLPEADEVPKAVIEIYVMNADGSGERRLTRNSSFIFSPAWSPDGETIAVVRADNLARPAIYLMNANGSRQRMLRGTVGAFSLAWSPDGNEIAFAKTTTLVRDPTLGVYVVSADGRTRRRLTKGNHLDPDWSPDGRRIVYANGVDGEIYVMNRDGSRPRRLTRHRALDSDPAWQPARPGKR